MNNESAAVRRIIELTAFSTIDWMERAAERIIAEHIEPLRQDRNKWRQANSVITHKCIETERALAKAQERSLPNGVLAALGGSHQAR